MATIISPAGLAGTALTANQLSILTTYTERLCAPYCVNSSLKPQYNVVYTTGTPTLNGTSVFVPVTATITIVVPSSKCCGSKTYLYTEMFDVAFQGQTAVPASVTIASTGRTSNPSGVKCCKASSYVINDSITITIA